MCAAYLGDVGRASFFQTNGDIRDHIPLIRDRIGESLNDPETRSLAVALVSRSFDRGRDPATGQVIPAVPYHGRNYRGTTDWGRARILCRPRDQTCEVTAIWDFLVLNFFYTQDVAGRDTYQTLQASLEQGGGDCDDATVAFAALLGAVGYTVIARVISLNGRSWDHIYPLVQLRSGRFLPLDLTERGRTMGWEFPTPAAVRDFLLVPMAVAL